MEVAIVKVIHSVIWVRLEINTFVWEHCTTISSADWPDSAVFHYTTN